MWYQTEQGIYHSLILIILGKKYVMMLRSALPKLNIAGESCPSWETGTILLKFLIIQFLHKLRWGSLNLGCQIRCSGWMFTVTLNSNSKTRSMFWLLLNTHEKSWICTHISPGEEDGSMETWALLGSFGAAEVVRAFFLFVSYGYCSDIACIV